MRIISCVCIYSISFYFCHNKLTNIICCHLFLLYCVPYNSYFGICYNICSLSPFVFKCVCVSTSTEFIKIACILLYKISYRKLQIMNFFLCCVFYSTINISKTCIAFCWYCFGWDRYANNIPVRLCLVIMLIIVNNWVFKFLWLGQFAMNYQRYFKGIWYLYSVLHQHYNLNLNFIFIAQV